MSVHEDPAREAWELLWRVMQANKPRFTALAQEMGLAPMQLHALRLIEPGDGVPMSSLAGKLFCDASNVTGIADRLEARGLVQRQSAEGDRRVKALTITPAGMKLREQVMELMNQPPDAVAALTEADQRALRDILARAVANL